MLDLVRKRHDGEGWIVFEELGDKPGIYANRHADAVALGVWASHKFEAHLYEFKISREDVKREMRDPKKAEGVGKYCHYWWLAVDDVKRINDLVIPDAWGILVAKKHGDDRRLVVHRKAPKLKPRPFDPLFAVSTIRNIRNRYIEPSAHKKLQEEMYQLQYGRTDTETTDLEMKIHNLEREQRRTQEMIQRFETSAGITLGEPSWEWGSIGEAVAVVRKIRENQLARGDIRADVHRLSKAAEEMEGRAAELAEAAVLLRSLMASRDHSERCSSQSGWRGRCTCGVDPLSKIEREISTVQEPAPAAPNGEGSEAQSGVATVRQ